MIHKTELEGLVARAHAARVTMTEVCERAGKHRQSWHRAFKRGRAEYTLIFPLENALTAIENERRANPCVDMPEMKVLRDAFREDG